MVYKRRTLMQTDISVKMCTVQFVLTISTVLVLSSVQAYLKESDFGAKFQAFTAPIHTTCASKTGIDEALIDKVRNGEFIEESTTKAYMTCILAEGRLIDENDEPNVKLAAILLPEKFKDETLKNVKSCYATHKGIKKREEKVFNVFKCYYDLNPDLFIFW